jgi:hypothetical protein
MVVVANLSGGAHDRGGVGVAVGIDADDRVDLVWLHSRPCLR